MDVPLKHALKLAFALAFCANAFSVPAQAASPYAAQIAQELPAAVAVRVGSSLNDSNAEAFYAQEKGFFRQVGLNVEVTAFNNGAAAAAALAGGAIDITIAPPMQIAQAITRGIPFTVIAAGALNTSRAPSGWVVVAKNSPIQSAKDLEGKTVAINGLKSSSENPMDAWLAKNGADVTKVHRIEMPSAQMPAALARGTIDAALILEPAYSTGLQHGDIRLLANPTGAMRSVYLQTAWFTTKQYATQHPDVVKKFAEAIYSAASWANAHQSESGAILTAHSKLNPDIASTMSRVQYARSIQLYEIAPELDIGYKYGRLSRPVSPTELVER